jgi:lipoyl(octanoyl) transferase
VLDVQILGLDTAAVNYRDAWELQRRVHKDVVAGRVPDTLLLLEHTSVYTAGKRTEPDERPTDGTEVIDVDRGGKITWHGPGQLVGYPIVRLPDPVDVVAHVRRLETFLIELLKEFGVTGERVDGRSGVWVRSDDHVNMPHFNKIAAIGIRVAEGVTMHGFSLNCSNSLEPYANIVACGIRDAGATTLSVETGRIITPSDVIDTVRSAFVAEFEEIHEFN